MDASLFCSTIYGIKNPEILREINDAAVIENVSKGTVLIRAGEPQTRIVFLMKGVFRGSFLNINGKEITDCIGFRPGTAAMASFGFESPAKISIEMMTAGKVMVIPTRQLTAMMRKYPELLVLYNKLLTDALASQWELKVMVYQCTAMQRYEWFLKKFPGLADKVSNKYIASYLGMNPVTLSRLRRSVRDGV